MVNVQKEILLETEISDIRLSIIADKGGYHLSERVNVERGASAVMELHQHSFYEFFFVPSGDITIVTEEESNVYQNRGIIIPPRFNHYTIISAKRGYCLVFALEYLPKKDENLYEYITQKLNGGMTVLPITDELSFYMEKLTECILEDSEGEEASHVAALVFLSIFKLLDAPKKKKNVSNIKYRNYVSILDTYISRHYKEKIKITDIADELHLCSKQVSRIIYKEYGAPLSQVVHRRRLSIACMLLKNTSIDINQIALSVGYEYENYFFRLFKDTYGMTPMEYRQNNK